MNWIHWALASAFFAGLTVVLVKAGVEGVNSHVATALRTSVVLVFTWAIALSVAPREAFSDITRRNSGFLIISGVATGLSWICYFRALQLGEASRVAPLDKLSVVFAIVFAAWFLGEKISILQWVGASLIVAGALLLAYKPPLQ